MTFIRPSRLLIGGIAAAATILSLTPLAQAGPPEPSVPTKIDPTVIPWLRVVAVSTSAGPDGDRLAHTSFIQRTETTGGLAPDAEECNAQTVGTIAEVPYTADYVFWKRVAA